MREIWERDERGNADMVFVRCVGTFVCMLRAGDDVLVMLCLITGCWGRMKRYLMSISSTSKMVDE